MKTARIAPPTVGDCVLSVRQPWASMLVSGEKPVEFRSWPTSYRGPLWIHASSVASGWNEAEIDRFGMDPEVYLRCGGIVGRVTLTACYAPGEKVKGLAKEWRKLGCDQFKWIVTDPLELEELLPCQGKLGIWKW